MADKELPPNGHVSAAGVEIGAALLGTMAQGRQRRLAAPLGDHLRGQRFRNLTPDYLMEQQNTI
jgi:hypothetical protein